MIDFPFNEECYGCGLCEEACPVHAITMRENAEGFRVPLVDAETCINCRKCEKLCIRLQEHRGIDLHSSEFYAYWQKDSRDRLRSTSGGAFYTMARAFVENWGGVVCGCVWNEKMEAEIICTDTVEGINRMRGSKYVQSSIRCYSRIRDILKQGRKVLFSGTPCQVGAVQRLFPYAENLYTVALICAEAPSPKAWRKCVQELESKSGSRMVDAVHRKKGCYGWLLPIAEYVFENGVARCEPAYTLDYYVRNMINGFFTRNSCYSCGYKGSGSTADVIVGDYWGLPVRVFRMSANAGCSVVAVNTERGKELFNLAREHGECEPASLEAVVKCNPRLLTPPSKNRKRDAAMADMDTLPFRKLVDKHCSMRNRKFWSFRILHALRLAGLVKRRLYPFGKEQER